jgi:xanthine dehydrogenase YagR molybdenum-binding subunit
MPARTRTRRRKSSKPIFRRRARCARRARFRECSRSNARWTNWLTRLKIDPLELRLINYAETFIPTAARPYSSKALRECYQLGAEKFGWKNRKFEPRSMRDGRLLVGWGTATGVWGAFQQPASVKITLKADGTAHVASATSDIGPGTYTVITLIAAEYLGLSAEK